MTTKITVAVGPNGEALNSKALRDGSRADRLETESTTKQAKQFVAGEVDKLTQGRDNPDSKYKPSRDPAAFARKKKEEGVTPGQFCGLKIEFEHFPLFGLWSQKRNASYMNIRVNGITPQGDLLPEVTNIELKRNLVTDTFNSPTPDGYVPESMFTSGYTPGNGPWGFCNWPIGIGNGTGVLDIQLGNTYYGLENFSDYAVLNGGQINADLTFSPTAYNDGDNFQPITTRCMGAIGASTSYTMYAEVFGPRQFSWQSPPEGYPPLADNPNTYVNGRTDDDDTTEGYGNYHQDPVHELFMLPFTGNKCFLLVIYTDYMIQTRSFSKQVSTVTTAPAFNYVVDPDTDPKPMTTNVIDYKRFEPDYNLPEGYEIEGLGFPGDPIAENQCKAKVTEAGANKIQTIKLYSINDGVITEVEEIPRSSAKQPPTSQPTLKGLSLIRLWHATTTAALTGSQRFTTATPVILMHRRLTEITPSASPTSSQTPTSLATARSIAMCKAAANTIGTRPENGHCPRGMASVNCRQKTISARSTSTA